jgi:NAD dependent epimerase/dehydratase
MKIFVTGADGFIGSHLVERLIKLGHKVKAFTFYNFRGSNGWLDDIDKNLSKDLQVISGDIRDYGFLEKQTKNVDVIYHLAALIAIPYSYYSPQSYIDTNITGTYNILKSSQKNNISKIVVTSTSEVYGTAQKVPIKENHSLSAQSPYAATKIAADQLALSFHKSFDLPVTILRPFNTYGPRQSARAVIPAIITQLVSKNKFIKIGNLAPTRDFTYVEDTVEAFILVLNKNIPGEVINIGNKFEISIKDILDIFKKDFNYNFNVIVDEKRVRSKKSEVFRLLASDIKAKKMLQWRPRYEGVAGFKKGLAKTLEWFNNPDNIRLYKSDVYNI